MPLALWCARPGGESPQVWALARRDHHVIGYDELRHIGYNRAEIRHRIDVGRLHRKAEGVFAVGNPNLTTYGRWMVAIKACGDGAVLSHLSAAVLWGIWAKEPTWIHVTVPRGRNPRCSGVKPSRRDLPGADVTKRHRIPVTTLVRTLIDLATVVTPDVLEDLVGQADANNLLRVDLLRGELESRPRIRGARILRQLIDRDTFTLSHSKLERLFIPLAKRAGLPNPVAQAQLGSARVDFFWPELNLVVECDSLRYHRTPFQQREDRERHHAHALAGRLYIPFTHHHVAREPEYVVRTLRALSAGTARRAG